jgi:hypothetical protein
LDFGAIRRMLQLWNEEVIRNQCWKCDAWAFCGVCAAQTEDKNGLRLDCTYKHRFQKIISGFIKYKEQKHIKEFENSNKSKTIKEYIRQL